MTTEKIVDEGSVDRYDFIKTLMSRIVIILSMTAIPLKILIPDLFDESSEATDVNTTGKGTTKINIC